MSETNIFCYAPMAYLWQKNNAGDNLKALIERLFPEQVNMRVQSIISDTGYPEISCQTADAMVLPIYPDELQLDSVVTGVTRYGSHVVTLIKSWAESRGVDSLNKVYFLNVEEEMLIPVVDSSGSSLWRCQGLPITGVPLCSEHEKDLDIALRKMKNDEIQTA